MEKVVLTKEQAEIVEKYKSVKGLAEKLSKAISEGYEIESEFNAGDKVMYKKEALDYPDDPDATRVFTLSNPVVNAAGWFYEGENMGWDYETDFRHATPEEIYWLETLGREKLFDFREGDAILDIHGDITPVNTEFQVNHAVSYFSNKIGKIKGIYPTESFKRYPQEDK